VTTPRNLDELRSVKDPAAKVAAAHAYIQQRQEAIAQARQIRDAALRQLAAQLGVTATARACRVSVSHVKAVRR
jgi:hypothetical protein